MKIKHDPIRYRDKYTCTLKGATIELRWYSGGNTWTPGDETLVVSGYPSYAGDSVLDDRIALLEMVVAAIFKAAQGTLDYPVPLEGCKKDKARFFRAWIDNNKEVLLNQ